MTMLHENHPEDEDMSGSKKEAGNHDIGEEDHLFKKDNRKEQTEKAAKASDVYEGKTIFIRNLSFDTNQESLKKYFAHFGQVEYALICKDKISGHSRGTGFVKFTCPDSAEAVLQSQKNDPHSIYLDDRRLIIDFAIDKKHLGQQLSEQNKNKKDRDKRNLYLAREGVIYSGSPAAEGVSPSDLQKRLDLEVRKRKALQLTTNVVSKTRLCIHNIPDSYDNLKLRKLFLSTVDDKKAVIVECRIMRNKTAAGKLTKGKGFGFVEFKDHSHALTALRKLNNNPTTFSDKRRPIVEFAIEDKMKLNAKTKRLEKAAKIREQKLAENANQIPIKKPSESKDPEQDTTEKVPRKDRFRKRLEKIRAMRLEKKAAKKNTVSDDSEIRSSEPTIVADDQESMSKEKNHEKQEIISKNKTSKEKTVDSSDSFSGIKAEPVKPHEKISIPKVNRKVTQSKKFIKERRAELKSQASKMKAQAEQEQQRLKKKGRKEESRLMKRRREEKVKDFDDFEESFLKKTGGLKTLVDGEEQPVSKESKRKKWFGND